MTNLPALDQIQQAHRHFGEVDPQTRQPLTPAADEPFPVDLFAAMLGYWPSYEEILDTYLRNFTHRGIPKSRPVQALNIEVVLTPQQMAEGAHLPLRIPVFEVCERCEGSGHAGFFLCDKCGGEGITTKIRSIDVVIPAQIGEETILPRSLRHLGIDNLYLNIRVRQSEGAPVV